MPTVEIPKNVDRKVTSVLVNPELWRLFKATTASEGELLYRNFEEAVVLWLTLRGIKPPRGYSVHDFSAHPDQNQSNYNPNPQTRTQTEQ